MLAASGRELDQARRLDRGLIALRWFVVAFGVFQTLLTIEVQPRAPDYAVPLAFVLVAMLAIGNVIISILTEGAERVERLRAIGLAAFVLDLGVTLGLVWAYANDPTDSTWVLVFILPLEGAIRYQLAGALVPVALTAVSETLREYSLASRFPVYRVDLANVAFRVGVQLVIAIVAGLMARSLRREADKARERARSAEEAAHLAEMAAERLRELDEMKSDFVAITSHELRSPLAAVRGFVNTMIGRLDDLSEQEIREFLEIIDQQSERLVRLVEDLLVVYKIEAGKMSFSPELVDLREVLADVVDGLHEARERIQTEVAPDAPERIVVDPHRLAQILTNLLQNALKFSPPASSVTLGARAFGKEVELAVHDHGVGIRQNEIAKIFDRFHQTDPSSTRQAEGAGLGLYITKRLVEAMGGSIRVESAAGEGSTFTVRLPSGVGRRAPSRPSEAEQAGRTAS